MQEPEQRVPFTVNGSATASPCDATEDCEPVSLTITLEGEELRAVAQEARRRGVEVSDVVAQALRTHLLSSVRREGEIAKLSVHVDPDPISRLPIPFQAGVRLLGNVVRWRWTIGRSRYSIGRGLVSNGRLRLRGPGRIVLGDNVNAWVRSGRNELITYRREASITIGENVRLNGAGLQAAVRISVGDNSVLGSCTLVDTDHHAISPDRRAPGAATRAAAIDIGRNVWIAGAALLKGVSVGDNSVIGYGSVVTSDVPSNVVVAGNPAKVRRRLDV
ncbi:MAG TPA: acyltransferase [Candidatus Sulfotelmatobacter sp.]|nr:acyltransferase [Candidatus Sulfotelmatobacter sp.]